MSAHIATLPAVLRRIRAALPLAALLAFAVLGACSREPVRLEGRLAAAVTPPAVIADWIIAGRNDYLLFDLRDTADFERAHLPGAVHVTPEQLRDPGVVRALPGYKKLVFYGARGDVDGDLLRPLFARGLHVLIMDGGYARWELRVLSKPGRTDTPELARRDAVARYFRGESALGSPEPVKEISAKEYLQPPKLPAPRPAPTYESEGC